MCDEDILALGEVLAQRDAGFIQVSESTGNRDADMEFIERLAPKVRGRLASGEDNSSPRGGTRLFTANRSRGRTDAGTGVCKRWAMRIGQGGGYAFTLEHRNLYDTSPEWRAITTGSRKRSVPRCPTRGFGKLIAAHDTEENDSGRFRPQLGVQLRRS